MKVSRLKAASPVVDAGPAAVRSDPGFRVRRASGLDAEAMLPLIRSHAAYEGAESSISLAALRSALDRQQPPLSAWVAAYGGGLVGYATTTLDFSTWAGRPFLHLDCLFVQDDCRGNGIGAALLDAVRAHASARRITEIQWQTPDWNGDAIRFYLREGASWRPKARFRMPIA